MLKARRQDFDVEVEIEVISKRGGLRHNAGWLVRGIENSVARLFKHQQSLLSSYCTSSLRAAGINTILCLNLELLRY
jgi:hypothetical protein